MKRRVKPYYEKDGIILYKGDCLWIMKIFEDKSFDMILCDLPYGTTACKWDSIINLDMLWKEYKRITHKRSPIVLTAQCPFDKKLGISNIGMLKYEWIWDRKRVSNPMLAKKRPLKQHENILIFYEEQPVYNPQPYFKSTKSYFSEKRKKHKSESYANASIESISSTRNLNRTGYPRSIINQLPPLNNLGKDKFGLHPTQKPIALFEYLIKTYTNENNIVLDNCAGSGTTGVACRNLGRKCVMVEKEEKYCQIIVKRLEGDL